MQTLKEDLERAREDYLDKVNSIQSAHRFADPLLNCISSNQISIIDFLSFCSIAIRSTDMEEVELFLIPHFSTNYQFFRDKKWNKNVYSWGIQYRAKFINDQSPWDNFEVDIEINLHLSDTCEMRAIPTGRKIKRTKMVTFEDDEMRYEIDCGNGEEVNTNG